MFKLVAPRLRLAQNLWVTFNNACECYIAKVYFYLLRNIARICRRLSDEECKLLMSMSRLATVMFFLVYLTQLNRYCSEFKIMQLVYALVKMSPCVAWLASNKDFISRFYFIPTKDSFNTHHLYMWYVRDIKNNKTIEIRQPMYACYWNKGVWSNIFLCCSDIVELFAQYWSEKCGDGPCFQEWIENLFCQIVLLQEKANPYVKIRYILLLYYYITIIIDLIRVLENKWSTLCFVVG